MRDLWDLLTELQDLREAAREEQRLRVKAEAQLAAAQEEVATWRRLFDETPKLTGSVTAAEFIGVHNRTVAEWRKSNEALRQQLAKAKGLAEHREKSLERAEADYENLFQSIESDEVAAREANDGS